MFFCLQSLCRCDGSVRVGMHTTIYCMFVVVTRWGGRVIIPIVIMPTGLQMVIIPSLLVWYDNVSYYFVFTLCSLSSIFTTPPTLSYTCWVFSIIFAALPGWCWLAFIQTFNIFKTIVVVIVMFTTMGYASMKYLMRKLQVTGELLIIHSLKSLLNPVQRSAKSKIRNKKKITSKSEY